jgi:hypothetical protein
MRNLCPFAARAVLGLSLALFAASCKPPAAPAPATEEAEPETLARTEFTERVENFFEYEVLKAGRPSLFRIHLTDLDDGSPVEKADVTLSARKGATAPVEVTAKVGKVTGIYVAELTLPSPGDYEIEFHIKNAKIDERLPLAGFMVE